MVAWQMAITHGIAITEQWLMRDEGYRVTLSGQIPKFTCSKLRLRLYLPISHSGINSSAD